MKKVNKLRGRISELGMTVEEFAQAMGISRATAHKKIEGKSDFSSKQIQIACDILDIPIENAASYFFT